MGRLILNVLSLLSAAICVAACSLWARSRIVCDMCDFHRTYYSEPARGLTHFRFSAYSARGEVGFSWASTRLEGPGEAWGLERKYIPHGLRFSTASVAQTVSLPLLQGFNFRWLESDGIGHTTGLESAAPLWLLAVTTAVFPTVWWRRRIVNRRNCGKVGRVCRRCGYDLRATPERCPECGTTPKVSA